MGIFLSLSKYLRTNVYKITWRSKVVDLREGIGAKT